MQESCAAGVDRSDTIAEAPEGRGRAQQRLPWKITAYRACDTGAHARKGVQCLMLTLKGTSSSCNPFGGLSVGSRSGASWGQEVETSA